jgi:hypothetical protein
MRQIKLNCVCNDTDTNIYIFLDINRAFNLSIVEEQELEEKITSMCVTENNTTYTLLGKHLNDCEIFYKDKMEIEMRDFNYIFEITMEEKNE